MCTPQAWYKAGREGNKGKEAGGGGGRKERAGFRGKDKKPKKRKRRTDRQSIENCIEQARKKKKGNETQLKDQAEQSVERECQAEHHSLTVEILEREKDTETGQAEHRVPNLLEEMGQAEQLSNKKEICQAEHPPYGTDRAEQQPGGNSGQICKLVKGNQAEQCMSLGGYRVGHQSWTKGQDEHHHEERGQAEQRQVDVSSTGCLGLGGLTGDQFQFQTQQ